MPLENPSHQRKPLPKGRQRLYLIVEAPVTTIVMGMVASFLLFFGLLTIDNFVPNLPWMQDKTEIQQVFEIAVEGGIFVAKLTLVVFLVVCIFPPVRLSR